MTESKSAALSCPRCQATLTSVLTKKKVLIDLCIKCKGVWLDEGELQFFVHNRKALSRFEQGGMRSSQASLLKCPKCGRDLRAGLIPGFRFEVDECRNCRGLFLDGHEFEKIQGPRAFGFPPPKRREGEEAFTVATTARGIAPTRNLTKIRGASLAFTSFTVLTSLYGILVGVLIYLTEVGTLREGWVLPITVAFVGLQFLIGPWIMDWSLSLVGSLSWTEVGFMPPAFKSALTKLCAETGIPLPKVGIIHDGTPQAFTYGRTPKSARLVLSEGILNLLTDDEVEAVVAHELGHIKHWDFVVMTIAQLVPVLLYQIYRMSKGSRRGSKGASAGSKKGGVGHAYAALIAYVAYLVTEYLVLFISRVREYYADQFSCRLTKKPNALLTALVKIGYGVLHHDQLRQDSKEGASAPLDSTEDARKAVQSMGIMNVFGSKQIALAFFEKGNQGLDSLRATIKDTMKWDLWSPWALFYEFKSTHPLTAKRIFAISEEARLLGQVPFIEFDETPPESYWDDFFFDLLIMLLPWVGAALGLGLAHFTFGLPYGPTLGKFIAVGTALGGIISTLYKYPQRYFLKSPITSLLRQMKVSPVKTFPVRVTGEIIGRGRAGYIFSEDLVLKDETGLIFLDHEPFGFNFFFALFKSRRFQGHRVEIKGWYRRAPTPYIEIKEIRSLSSNESSRAYTFEWIILGWAAVLLVALYVY